MSEVMSDEALLHDMRNGHRAAFSTLYQRHHAALFRYAILRCGSAANAADVVQEVFLKLLSDRLNYDSTRGALRFYLFGVARKLALQWDGDPNTGCYDSEDHEEDWEPEVACAAPGPLERLLQDQVAEQARLAIAHLAPHYRDVLILFEMQELSYQEIADICQINVGTVRSRLARARQFLAQEFSRRGLCLEKTA